MNIVKNFGHVQNRSITQKRDIKKLLEKVDGGQDSYKRYKLKK